MRAEDSIIELEAMENGNSKFKPLLSQSETIIEEEQNEEETDSLDYKMIETYKIAKTVKLYAGIDTIFNGFYVFYNPWYIVPTLLSVLGYFGALEYNLFMLCIYFFYQACMICIRIGLNVDSFIHTRYSTGGLILMVVMSSLLTIFDLYILRFIYKMARHIKTFSRDDVQKLKTVKVIKTKFLYW